MRPGRSATARIAASTPGMNDTPVVRVVTHRERLPHAAHDDLLAGHEPAGADGVHRHAVDPRATGAVGIAGGGVGQLRRARVAPGGRDDLRRAGGGSGRRVDLVGVMHLDHLDGLEERRRGGGEAHHQHGADREVRDDQDADLRVVTEQVSHLGDPGVVEARRADDDVHAVLDAPAHVVESDVGLGEVEGDLGAGLGDRGQVVVDVDLRDDLEPVGLVDGLHGRRTHPSLGSQDRHSRHASQPSGRMSRTSASTAQPSCTSVNDVESGERPSRSRSGRRTSGMTPRSPSRFATPAASGTWMVTWLPRRSASRGETTVRSSRSTSSRRKSVSAPTWRGWRRCLPRRRGALPRVRRGCP